MPYFLYIVIIIKHFKHFFKSFYIIPFNGSFRRRYHCYFRTEHRNFILGKCVAYICEIFNIGYYFIPFLNLYKPFRAMKEIWKISENPVNWKNNNSSTLLNWWWALWLFSCFLGQMSWKMSMKSDTLNDLNTSTSVSIISEFVEIPLILVAFFMISEIARRQEGLVSGRVQL